MIWSLKLMAFSIFTVFSIFWGTVYYFIHLCLQQVLIFLKSLYMSGTWVEFLLILRFFSTGTASWLVDSLVPVVTRMIQPESILKGFSTWFISSILTNLIRFFWCWDPRSSIFFKGSQVIFMWCSFMKHTHTKKTLNSLTDNTVIRYHTYNCWVITTQQITVSYSFIQLGQLLPV